MAEIKIKSNGLRNELKEIRKSIDKLTNVFHHIVDIWANGGFEQTHERYEKSINDGCTCGNCRNNVLQDDV